MSNKKYLLSLFLLLLWAGCAAPAPERAKAVPAPSPIEKKIAQADSLLRQKNYRQAFILYSEAQKETQDVKLFRTLQLKIADTLLEMRNYPAALAALAPMPELPATFNDCQKLVMAARVLQKMKGKGEHIEALYEVALDNTIDEPGIIAFKASGYAELGKVYAANKKTSRAVKCFEYAAKLYTMVKDEENARACRNIMEYLR